MSHMLHRTKYSLYKVQWQNSNKLKISKEFINKKSKHIVDCELGYTLNYLKKVYRDMGKINLAFSEMGCTNYSHELEQYEVWLSECDLHYDNKY